MSAGAYWLEPFSYGYMLNAMWVSALVGGVCAFLAAFLMLKGWSLIGDALSHSVVPGVAGAYMLGLPFALGAFLAGGLAAGAMLFLTERSGLKTDVIIGLIFTSFFGLGLFIVSISPVSIDLQSITMGNILAITPSDTLQLALIGGITVHPGDIIVGDVEGVVVVPHAQAAEVLAMAREIDQRELEQATLISCFPGGGFGGRDSSPFSLMLALCADFADGNPVKDEKGNFIFVPVEEESKEK